MVNVARNDANRVRSFMGKDTISIGIVRHPKHHFQSVFEYIDMSFFMKQLTNRSELLTQFLNDSAVLKKVINLTGSFEPVFHLLKNGMFHLA